MKRERRNRGWFAKGWDPRRRRGFTKEECRLGYQRCLEIHPHLGCQWMKLRMHESKAAHDRRKAREAEVPF